MIMLWALTALLTQQPASSSAVTLDFDYYKANVEPIFLERNPGFTRCVVCHSGEGRVGFLEELSPNATMWDDEQSRLNFEAVSRLVSPGQPLARRLLNESFATDFENAIGNFLAAQHRAITQTAFLDTLKKTHGSDGD